MIEASIKQRTRQAEDYSKEINTCYSSLAESRTRMRQCRKLAEHQDIVLRKTINKYEQAKLKCQIQKSLKKSLEKKWKLG